MIKEIVEQAEQKIGEARRMIDIALGNYLIGLTALQRDIQTADELMVWRDSNLYSQLHLSQWNPGTDLHFPCAKAIVAARSVMEIIMDGKDVKDSKYWQLMNDPENKRLSDEMMATYEKLHALHKEYAVLQRKYLGDEVDSLFSS